MKGGAWKPALDRRVIACRACPRLVRWREKVACEKVRRFAGEKYWGKPLPGFGDPGARVLIVGLAPAAHGGNRTGRMFTGDESGNWLFRALHQAGFASQAESVHRADGVELLDCYITAAARCAPPANRPAPAELRRCRPFLLEEIAALKNVKVVVGLGRIGCEAALQAYRAAGRIEWKKKPEFGHARTHTLGGITFIASYHPSQQNTFTGRLTRPMFDRVFADAAEIVRSGNRAAGSVARRAIRSSGGS
jgi:uracil-DNA glycosylase family 4